MKKLLKLCNLHLGQDIPTLGLAANNFWLNACWTNLLCILCIEDEPFFKSDFI